MRDAAGRAALSIPELVAMTAALSALNAFAIDIMLPALPNIAAEFALANANDRQLVIVVYIASFGLGQLAYGPLADALGRRPVLLWALGLFIAGAALSVFAPTFSLFLAARVLQGLGAAATRVIAIAVVRDMTEGRRMAQIMSMAMTVFMIVPIVAPGLGQLILLVAPWRWCFGALLIYAAAVAVWAAIRLPETLRPEYRRMLDLRAVLGGYVAVLRERQSLGYTIASTFIGACLFGYIACSEQIYRDVYGLGAAFPLAFAAIALAVSGGTFINSRLVVGLGMRRLSHTMLMAFILAAAAHAALTAWAQPPLALFMLMLALCFGVFGLIASNFNALAMEPVAHVAGSASALFGAVTAIGGGAIGGLIARGFDGTTQPFTFGVALTAVATLAALLWTERGRLFVDPPRQPGG